jgi:predicted anti-sigma-YlaC factor YlaD
VSNPRPPHLHPSAAASDLGADEITCVEFVELVTDYLEGALHPSALDLVEEHLVMCDWCATYLDQMQSTLECLGSLRDAEPPGQPSERLLAAVRARAGADPGADG